MHLLLPILVSWASANGEILACPSSGFQSCEEVQAYRASAQAAWEPDPAHAPADRLEAISLKARELAGHAMERRERDTGRVLLGLDRLGVSEMSRSDLRKTVAFFTEHVTGVIALLRSTYAREIARGVFPSAFPKWIKDRVIGIFTAALTGDFSRIDPSVLDEGEILAARVRVRAETKALETGIEAYLFGPDFASDRERGEYLRKIVVLEDRAQDFAGFLTPYHARVLLLYQLASRLEPAERDALAADLELKSNVTEFLPPRAGQASSRKFGAYVFHDGYFFGATNSWTDAILKPEEQTPRAQNASSDCSIFTQKVLEAVGMKGEFSGRRMTTADMVAGKYDWAFRRTALCSEKELVPGDVVARNGHVYTFTGYGKAPSGAWELRIAEATGNFSRNVRLAALPIYDPGCKKSLYTQGKYFRFRVKD